MNEIGLKLKAKREENGVSIEETAVDLKVKPKDIMSLEMGKKDDFKDVMVLKNLIRDYAKYLGLDSDKILDEFNEFLFDFTSKIPVKAIEQAKKKKDSLKRVESPYTEVSKFSLVKMLVIVALIIVVIVLVIWLLVKYFE